MHLKYKILTIILLILSIFTIPTNNYAVKLYRKNSIVLLKAQDGNILNDGDLAVIEDPNIGDNQLIWYELEASSGATENSPSILAPTTNPGSKRWIMQTIYPHEYDEGAVTYYDYAGNLADDSILTLPASTQGGWGKVTLSNGSYWGHFEFTNTAIVTISYSSASVINSDTDGNWCIIDGGSTVQIKNRLGSTQNINVIVFYY